MATQKYLHINGVLTNYSDAHPVNLGFTTSSPAQCDFVIELDYTATLPIVGQSVEWFRRDTTRVFGGVISQIDSTEMWESGGSLYVHISAVGYDDRLFRRTTWNRGALTSGDPPRCAQYRSYAGLVDTSGTAVSWVSNIVSGVETSDRFGLELAGKTVVVNGSNRVVSSVDSPEHLTLTSSAGSHSSVAYSFTIYSGDVVRDLLDGNAYPHGLLGGGYAEFEGFTWTGTSIQQGAVITNKGLLFSPPVPIHDAIQTILDANPNFYFAVDADQVAYFALITLVPAPGDFTPTSGKQKRGIDAKITAEDVRNVEISVTNPDAVLPITDTFIGNGSTRSWFTTKPIGQVAAVLLNAVDATAADGSSTTVAKFYYLPATREFWQDHGDPVLTGADTLTISYKALFDDLMEYEDSGARAARAGIEGSGFGRYEKVIDRTGFSGKVDALADSTASVTRLEDNYYSVNVSTFELGYRVGMSFLADVPKLQLGSVVLFIDEVSMNDGAVKGTPYDWEYTLKCISVNRRITELQVLRNAFSGSIGGGISGGGTASSGSVLVIPVDPPPLQATSVASSEKAVARTPGLYGQTGLIITTTVTVAPGNTATYLQAWISKDAGVNWVYQGPFDFVASSTTFEFSDLAPTIDADGVTSPEWIVKVLLSNTHATSDQTLAVSSTPFTVLQTAQPGATVCSNAHLGTATYTKDADGNWSFAVPVIWDIAVTAEIWTTRLEVRNVDVTHSPMPGQWGEWRKVEEQDHPGQTVTANNVAGWMVHDAAFQYKYYEFRLIARSRSGTDAPPGTTGSGWVVQTTAWSGAAYLDFAATVQTGSIPATRLAAGAIPSGVTLPTTQLTGSITAAQIGSVNASAITGSISAAQIGSVNASTITGSITAAQIGSVNASAITGSITSAQIASVTAGSITGVITAGQIGTLTAGQITGVIVSSQLATGIINSVSLLATALFSNGVVNNGSNIIITPANMTTGTWTASQIGSVNAGVILGTISASQIGSVNAAAIVGTISSTQIGSINAATITIGLVGSSQISSINASQLNVGTITVGSGGMTFSGTGGINVNDGSGNVTSIKWQTLTAGYGVGINGNFSANGSMFCSSNFWCLSQISGNTLAIYNSGVGTLDVVDNNFIFIGRGVNIPSYSVIANSFYIGGTQVINSSGQFVGLGIVMPSYGMSCSGVNVYNLSSHSTYIVGSGSPGVTQVQGVGQYFGMTTVVGLERAWAAGGCYLWFVGGTLVNIT